MAYAMAGTQAGESKKTFLTSDVGELHYLRMLSTAQVAGLCGVTLRQLQWWDETKLIPTPKPTAARRRRRLYSDRDVSLVKLTTELQKRGMTIPAIRPIVKRARKQVDLDSPGYLLIDGSNICKAFDPAEVIAYVQQATNGARLIPLPL